MRTTILLVVMSVLVWVDPTWSDEVDRLTLANVTSPAPISAEEPLAEKFSSNKRPAISIARHFTGRSNASVARVTRTSRT